jgi:hypothetical protein
VVRLCLGWGIGVRCHRLRFSTSTERW